MDKREKMKRAKLFKLLTKSLILLLMCFGGVFFGVTLALSSSNVNTGGSVNFVATDVMADITGSVNGTATQSTLKDINITWSTSQDEINNMSSSWRGLILDFVKETNSVTLTINIKNKSSERAVSGLVSDNFNISNITTARKVGENSVSSFSEVTILPNTTHSFSISMSVTDLAKSVEGTWSLAINLTNQGVPNESAYQNLSFTYNDTNKTAEVKANQDNLPTGELAIPSKVMHNDVEYDVTSIGESAFDQCRVIQSIIIPDSVTSIGLGIFARCHELTSITVDKNNPIYSSYENGIYKGTTLVASCQTTIIKEDTTVIDSNAFYYCAYLKSVTIPASVTSIEYSAFELCTRLERVTFAEGLESIKKGAFSRCIALESITIPASVTSIGSEVFGYCDSLTSITVDKNNSVYSSYENGIYKGTMLIQGCQTTIIKEGTTELGFYSVFRGVPIKSITIPESVISIGSGAFFECTSLESVIIPEGVTSIGDSAFGACTALKSIIIPEGVKSIGTHMFWECTSLESVTLPDSLTNIERMAFYKCTSLQSITIPKNVTIIGVKAFMYCSAITSATFETPEGWRVTDDATAVQLSSTVLANPTTAVSYLTETYSAMSWKRS